MQSMIDNCRCANCLLAERAMVPSDERWEKHMGRSKPRVPGFRCHASRPTTAGFAIVRGGDCPYFTTKTGDQPLRHLVSEAVKAKEVNA